MKVASFVFGDPNKPGRGYCSDLYFVDWKWTEITRRFGITKEKPISSEDAYQWACMHLPQQYWTRELHYVSKFSTPYRFRTRSEEFIDFSPEGWKLVTMSLARHPDGPDFRRQILTNFLFTRDAKYFLVTDVRPLFSEWADRDAAFLEKSEAVKWFNDNGMAADRILYPDRFDDPSPTLVTDSCAEGSAPELKVITDSNSTSTPTAIDPIRAFVDAAGHRQDSPPPWKERNDDWIFSRDLARLISKPGRTLCELRKRAENFKDEFGDWGVDEVGVFRRNVVDEFAAYYIPKLRPRYRGEALRYVESKREGAIL